MKTLQVPKIQFEEGGSLSELSDLLDREGVGGALEETCWREFPYKPDVRFSVAHTGRSICLKYRVREQAIIAEKTETNSPVSEDSCVELFLGPSTDGFYYNFEWSCIGTCLVGVGTERHGRELLDAAVIDQIRRQSTLGNEPFTEKKGEFDWSLVAEIPVSVLMRHGITDLTGVEGEGNLYKCGDHLSVPHYATWQRIETPAPDYHRPEQFGRIIFLR